MILRTGIFLILSIVMFTLSQNAYAQDGSQSLSVTPPLFQLSVEPGDVWQSSIRVVNTNPFPLTVYAEVVDFSPQGEGGLGKFMPILNTDEAEATLAEWIEIPEGPHIVQEGRSAEISFLVDVPRDAAPGGHFAAILISTEPPKSDESLALITTQTVASLFFARIEGAIIENAAIREFSVTNRSIELPEAEFSLRFENKGNVHVQPRGDIIIENMWGTERGIIPINHDTHYGNVLPSSIRDFRFSWKGEPSLADIGRYKAIATVGYGEESVKSVSATTYFWVIPIRGAIMTILFIIAFLMAITWMIRLYVRRMLILAGVDPDEEKHVLREEKENTTLPAKKTPSVTAPLKEGTLDLRTRLTSAEESIDVARTLGSFVLQYKHFFIALALLIVCFIALVEYAQEVSNTDTEFEVTIEEGTSSRTFTNDDLERLEETN